MRHGAGDINFAVIIIAYNQEISISDAIESVIAQTRADKILEIVVVDDCSTDNTVRIAAEYARMHEKIRVIRHKFNSGGCAQPRNTGIRATRAAYISFLDGDDTWEKQKTAVEYQILQRQPQIGLLYSDYTSAPEGSKKRRKIRVKRYFADEDDQLEHFFIHGGPIIPSSATVSRAALKRSGLFDPKVKFNEDSDLWNRLAVDTKLHHTKKILVVKKEWYGSLGSEKFRSSNILAKNEITKKVISRHPTLNSVKAKRDSIIKRQLGNCKIRLGETCKGRNLIWESIKLDSRNFRSILYLLLSFITPLISPHNTTTPKTLTSPKEQN